MPDVPGDEFYRDLPLHASRQSDHRPVVTEDRSELPHGTVLADLLRRSRSAERLWFCCWKNGKKQVNFQSNCFINWQPRVALLIELEAQIL